MTRVALDDPMTTLPSSARVRATRDRYASEAWALTRRVRGLADYLVRLRAQRREPDARLEALIESVETSLSESRLDLEHARVALEQLQTLDVADIVTRRALPPHPDDLPTPLRSLVS